MKILALLHLNNNAQCEGKGFYDRLLRWNFDNLVVVVL
jgi:hypothetical protein